MNDFDRLAKNKRTNHKLQDTLPDWAQDVLNKHTFAMTAPDAPESIIRRLNELHQPPRFFQWGRLDVQIRYLDDDTALFCLRRMRRNRSVDMVSAIAYGKLAQQPGKHGTAVTGYLRFGITTPLTVLLILPLIFTAWAWFGVTEVLGVYPIFLGFIVFALGITIWFMLQDYYALRRIVEGLDA